MRFRLASASIVVLALSGGCSTSAAPADTKGACADVFQGQVCTWATTRDGAVVEAGATVPLASIAGAPETAPMTWPPVPLASIDLPAVVREQTALSQLTVNWEAGGHPPASFMTPHFDFHFYALPKDQVAAIDCKDERKPAGLPAAYGLPDIPLPHEMAHMMGVSTLVGLCVPNMGMHAIPHADIERADAFSGTMVVGYYKGAPIFLEPMIARATLMKQASFDLPMPEVTGFGGPVPTRFRAEYDPNAQAYRLVLSGFTAR